MNNFRYEPTIFGGAKNDISIYTKNLAGLLSDIYRVNVKKYPTLNVTKISIL
jgi:hypothetical protein